MPNDTESTPRFAIPDEWLIGAACPVCGYPNLTIERYHDRPDHLACSVCAILYEVAQDGVHVRLRKFSSRLPSEIGGRWMKPVEISEIVARIRRETAAPAAPVQPVGEISLAMRAQKLAELGNSPQRVREVLLRLPGVTLEQVDEVLTPVVKKAAHQGGSILWGVTTAMLVVMIFLVVGMLILPGLLGKKESATQGSSTNEVTNNTSNGTTRNNYDANNQNSLLDPASLPAPLRTLIPSGIEILKPTPITVKMLDTNTQPEERCPQSPGEAARLFGGNMQDWSAGTQGVGWIMISLQSQNITIPKDMSAGYLEVSGTPEISSVIGPVIINNVNFVAVSCE